VSDARTRIVAQGYDEIGEHFAVWRERIVGDPRRWWADQLTSRLTEGARILELGCGSGVPDTRLLAERFRVTGVDISPEQIKRARASMPNAGFIVADFTARDFVPGSFDAVAAFYVLNHVPRDLLAGLLGRIHSWLVPGGYLLATFGTSDTESWVGEWLGTTMFFSSFPPETTNRLLADTGFEVLLGELGKMREPEPDGEVEFHWVLART
jgi:cyclopropane fatty-acyl-phospholipid synthase-like methyltransferase